MTAAETNSTPRPRLRRSFRLAIIGLVCGLAGLGIAAYRMTLESEPPPDSAKAERVSDFLAQTIKKTAEKLRHKQPVAPVQPIEAEWPTTKKLSLAASICGFIGFVFGCASWIVREHRRYTWAALCIGIMALAWTQVVVAVAMTVAGVIGLWLISKLG